MIDQSLLYMRPVPAVEPVADSQSPLIDHSRPADVPLSRIQRLVAQRMLASKSEKDALGGVLFFNIAHYVLRPWPWILVALCSIIVYPELADIQKAFPHLDPSLIGHDIAYPAMLKFLPVGFIGLMVGGLIAANSSTILTHLNWGASYLVHDFYRSFLRKGESERHYVMAGRVATIGLFLCASGLVFLLDTAKDSFDIILIDAYRGPFVPFHLLTTEFYKLVAAHLKPGGVAVQNVEPSTMLFDSAVATIASAFDNLVFFEGQGNIVILAYDGPKKDDAEIARIAAERQAKYGFRYDLTDILSRRYMPEQIGSAKPLTDDFAPVEYLKAIERHNEKQT